MNNTVKIIECRQSAAKSWLTAQRPYAGLDFISTLHYSLEKPFLEEESMWARYYDRCVNCSKTNFPHMANGKCASCYAKDYRAVPSNWKKIQQKKKEWYNRNVKGTNYCKILREQKHFGGNREQVLARDNYTCQECGSKDKLVVHHIDGKGRGHDNSNHSLDNLTTLCRACHVSVHRNRLLATRRASRKKYWSPRHKLTDCKECNTSEVAHGGFGYCKNCYARYLRRDRVIVEIESRRDGPNSMAT